MKFALQGQDIQKLRVLFDSLAWNMDVSDFLNEELLGGAPLEEGPFFDFFDSIEEGQSKIIPEKLTGYEEPGLKGHLPKVECFDVEPFVNDPVGKALGNLSANIGDYVLSQKTLPAYQPFLSGEIVGIPSRFYAENAPIGFFKSDYAYLDLSYKGTTWMSLLPHEVITMGKAIEGAEGKCLVYGLGLGYMAALLALKDEVTEVTVIEKEKAVIDIFEEAIRPKLSNVGKIKIIQGDALEFIAPEDTDYLFIDLWHNEEDGLPLYAALAKKEKGLKPVYWIEDSLITYFRRLVTELLLEEIEDVNPIEDEGHYAPLFKSLKETLKDKTFKTYSEIEAFLSDESLKALIRSLR